jgi:hypothetical protein
MFLEPQYLPTRNPLRRGASTKHRDIEPLKVIGLFVGQYTYIYGKEPKVILTYWSARGIWHDWMIELQHK